MKNLYRCIVICLCLLLTFALNSLAFAESRPGALSLTLGGGYEYLASKRRMENPGVGFVAIGYDFTHEFGIEGFLANFHTHFKRNMEDNRRISGTLFAIDGVYHFYPYGTQPYTLQPYLLAGFGVTGLSPNRTNANNEGNINGAIGLMFSLHHAVAFRFEARDFYGFVGGKNDVMLDAGISFTLDMC